MKYQVCNKIYSGDEIEDLPKKIAYRKDGFLYVYELREKPVYNLYGTDFYVDEDIFTATGDRAYADKFKRYSYVKVYSTEPEVKYGVVDTSNLRNIEIFREVVFDNGEKELAIDFHDKDKEILSVFLFSEIDDFQDRIINIIDKVINKESSYEKFMGNVCRIEVNSHTTKISDIFEMNVPCEIETKELRKLIDIWIKKLDEFNKTGEI